MSGLGKLVVQRRSTGAASTLLAELVQAWARDIATGEPRHILELGAERRGARSGCECPSCGLPLTAVNAAKTNFVRRPHFRHPEGAARDDCMVLAARAAVMRQFQEEGWLDLPRRRMSGKAAGLSGAVHEAWVEMPPERVRIRNVDFRDMAAAVLTLEDGRQLRVELMATLETSADLHPEPSGRPVPTIILLVDDPSLAGMAPDELRRRLQLLPDALCWQAHWRDAELAEDASRSALCEALRNLDEVPDDLDLPPDLAPELKRQSVLHFAVMKLLAESKQLRVPGWTAEAEAKLPDGRLVCRKDVSEPELLRVDLAELEVRFGSIVPDVACKAWPVTGGDVLWPLFIEVTVTNHMTSERLARIREAGEPTLEVDLSLTGGRIDRDGLRNLVIDGLEIKRWLFHPAQSRRTSELEREVAIQVDAAKAAAARRAKLRAIPILELADRYRDVALQLADAEAVEDSEGRQPPSAAAEASAARAAFAGVVEALEAHGYPEAGDANLIGARGMIARILSIQLGRPVGYRLDNVAGVLNAIAQSTGVRRAETSVYLIAVRTYKPRLSEKQQAWFEEWAGSVRESVMRNEETYLRDPSYDRLLSLIFPEMSGALAKAGGKRRPEDAPAHGDWKAAKHAGVPTRQTATFLHASSRVGGRRDYLDTKPGEWLRGRDLEEWKRTYPEAAKNWFAGDGVVDSPEVAPTRAQRSRRAGKQ
jgi:hypothetical protein